MIPETSVNWKAFVMNMDRNMGYLSRKCWSIIKK